MRIFTETTRHTDFTDYADYADLLKLGLYAWRKEDNQGGGGIEPLGDGGRGEGGWESVE